MSTSADSEDPDKKMQHNAAFYQGLHCKGKTDLQTIEFWVFWVWFGNVCLGKSLKGEP